MSALKNPVLVLNSGWVPIHIVTVKKSIKLVCNENAKFVEPKTFIPLTWEEWAKLPPEPENFVQGVSSRYRVPEIVVASNFDKLPTSLVKFSRTNIFKRDNYRCQYCGVKPTKDELTIDHVVPRAQNGRSTFDNTVLACLSCNAKKADRTPQEAGMELLSTPKRPVWKPKYSKYLYGIDSWKAFIKE